MNKNLPIGIMDSGVGGLTAVVQMNLCLPQESIIYFGDSKRMPYGNKSTEEIISYANQMIRYLENQGVKAILVACNTISSQFENLQSNVALFSIVDAGATAVVKETDKNGSVGVIATCATVTSGIYEKTIRALNPNLKVSENSSASLPKIIDSQLDNLKLLEDNIKECIDPILEKDRLIKTLLLGCSHFPIIKREIGQLYPELKFIDPAKEQVYILKEFLDKNQLNADGGERKIALYTTAETYEYAAAIKRLKLEIDTLMKVKLFAED